MTHHSPKIVCKIVAVTVESSIFVLSKDENELILPETLWKGNNTAVDLLKEYFDLDSNWLNLELLDVKESLAEESPNENTISNKLEIVYSTFIPEETKLKKGFSYKIVTGCTNPYVNKALWYKQ